VLYHCARQRNDFARIVLLVGARSPADLLYVGEIERLAKSRRIDVRMTVDRADVAWTGEVGVVTALLEGIELDPARTLAMLCGPEVMMRFAIRELEKHGVPPASIWLSLERNMKCAVGHCGHCQLGPAFLCKDGPVFRLDRVTPFFGRREL
jgi:NAD(P)H-flavin reductase